jgi:hypothetical protein
MALTRDFKETVRGRVQRDPAFRRELLREGVESFLAGDVETGRVYRATTTSTPQSASPNWRRSHITLLRV